MKTARLLSPAVLGIACGAVLVPLNSTMLAVALPSVMAEFGVSAATVATLVTVYLAAVVVALPVAGMLGDRMGHRAIFLAGVGGFAASSLLAGLAGAFPLLVVARVLQAASGALISTGAVALVRAAAPPDRRGAAFGLFDMLVTTSAAIGPFVGGVVVDALDWRWMFVLAVPVAAIAALTVGWWHPPRATAHEAREPAPAARSAPGRPLDRLRQLVNPAFAAAVAGVLGATVILHGTFILVPLFVEGVLGNDPLVSGIVLLGVSGVSAVAAPFGGRSSDRAGRRAPAVIGSLVTGLGLAGLWLLIGGRLGIGASAVSVAVLLGLVGAGFGLAGSPRQAAALDAVPHHAVGMGAATYYTGRYLGGVIGASTAGLILGSAASGERVALAFLVLALVAVAVAVVSLGLPGRGSMAPLAVTDEPPSPA